MGGGDAGDQIVGVGDFSDRGVGVEGGVFFFDAFGKEAGESFGSSGGVVEFFEA